jgi:hypothetical protein
MLFTVENRTEHWLTYKAGIRVPKRDGLYQTSVMPLGPGLSNGESWPSPIDQLALKNFSFTENIQIPFCDVESENFNLSVAGGPAFDLVDTTKTVGAPLFALFERRVPRVPTAGDFASQPHATRSRNEISLHPTFTSTSPASPDRYCR